MLNLYFRATKVGHITHEFEHQGTWFGDFELSPGIQPDTVCQRLCEFIDFCQGWHSRAGLPGGGDADDFDQFSDMLGEQLWTIVDESNRESEISDAPMFSGGRRGEISWFPSS